MSLAANTFRRQSAAASIGYQEGPASVGASPSPHSGAGSGGTSSGHSNATHSRTQSLLSFSFRSRTSSSNNSQNRLSTLNEDAHFGPAGGQQGQGRRPDEFGGRSSLTLNRDSMTGTLSSDTTLVQQQGGAMNKDKGKEPEVLSPLSRTETNDSTSQQPPAGQPQSPNAPAAPAAQLHPEIRSVVTLSIAHAHKVYFSGPMTRRIERHPDGQRQTKDVTWREVWAQLGGTTLSIWDMQEIEEASKRGAEVPPAYVNVTDAFVQVLGSVTIPATPTTPAKKYTNVITLNTAGLNLQLFACPNTASLLSWAAALRLSSWEKSRLEEIYTAHLLRMSLSENGAWKEPRSPLVNGKMEGWVRIRVAGQTDWKKLWMVIHGAPHLPDAGHDRSNSPTTNRRSRVSGLFGRPRSPSHGSNTSPTVQPILSLYLSSKNKDRKKALLTMTDLTQAFAVYPERPELITRSTLLKIEGLMGDEELAGGMRNREAWMLIMPEVEPGRPGSLEMIKWLVGLHDAFKLYGRPASYTWDPRDPVSMMFAYPVGPHRDLLFLDRELAETLDPRDDRTSAVRTNLRNILIERMRSQLPPTVPKSSDTANGNGHAAGGEDTPKPSMDGPPTLPPIGGQSPPRSDSPQLPPLPAKDTGFSLPPLNFDSDRRTSPPPAQAQAPTSPSRGSLSPITERSNGRSDSGEHTLSKSPPLAAVAPSPTSISPPASVRVEATSLAASASIATNNSSHTAATTSAPPEHLSILGRDLVTSPIQDSQSIRSLGSSLAGVPPRVEPPSQPPPPPPAKSASPPPPTSPQQQQYRSYLANVVPPPPTLKSQEPTTSHPQSPSSNMPGSPIVGSSRVEPAMESPRSVISVPNLTSPHSPPATQPFAYMPTGPATNVHVHANIASPTSPTSPISPPPTAGSVSVVREKIAGPVVTNPDPPEPSASESEHDYKREAGALYMMQEQQRRAVAHAEREETTTDSESSDGAPRAGPSSQPMQQPAHQPARPPLPTPPTQAQNAFGQQQVRRPGPSKYPTESSMSTAEASTEPSIYSGTGTPYSEQPPHVVASPVAGMMPAQGTSREVLGRRPSGARAPPPASSRRIGHAPGDAPSSLEPPPMEEGPYAQSATPSTAADTPRGGKQHDVGDDPDVLAALSYLDVADDGDFDDGGQAAREEVRPYVSLREMPQQTMMPPPPSINVAEVPLQEPSPQQPPFKSSFAPSKQAAERKARTQAKEAAHDAAVHKPGRPNGKARKPSHGDRTAWADSSDEEEDDEEDEEDDEDEDDEDEDGKGRMGRQGPVSSSGSLPMNNGQGQGGMYAPPRETSPGMMNQRMPRSLPQIPGGRNGSPLDHGGAPRRGPMPDQYADPSRSRNSPQLRSQAEAPVPGAARQQNIWSSVLDPGRNVDFNPNQRDTFIQLEEPSETMTKAFQPQGLLSAGLQDKQDRSAKRQEEFARETGGSLVNVPSKPPPPQTGLLGAVTAHERERKREGGLGAALTERERDRRLAEDRQRKIDDMQRQQLEQQQQMFNMYGGAGAGGGLSPQMTGMMGGGMGMNPYASMYFNPMMGGGMGAMPYMNPQHMFAAQQAAQAYQQAMISMSVAGSQMGGGEGGDRALSPAPTGMMGGMGMGYDPRMSMMGMPGMGMGGGMSQMGGMGGMGGSMGNMGGGMGGMPGMNGMGMMGMQMTGASSPGIDPRLSMMPNQFDANFGAPGGGQYAPGQMNRFSSSPGMGGSPADSPKPMASNNASEVHANGEAKGPEGSA